MLAIIIFYVRRHFLLTSHNAVFVNRHYSEFFILVGNEAQRRVWEWQLVLQRF